MLTIWSFHTGSVQIKHLRETFLYKITKINSEHLNLHIWSKLLSDKPGFPASDINYI